MQGYLPACSALCSKSNPCPSHQLQLKPCSEEPHLPAGRGKGQLQTFLPFSLTHSLPETPSSASVDSDTIEFHPQELKKQGRAFRATIKQMFEKPIIGFISGLLSIPPGTKCHPRAEADVVTAAASQKPDSLQCGPHARGPRERPRATGGKDDGSRATLSPMPR